MIHSLRNHSRILGRPFLLFVLIAVVLMGSSQPIVNAQISTEQKLVFRNGISTFNVNRDCAVSSSDATLADNATADERLQFIYTHMRGRGLTPIAAAAVAGNISVESMGGDPTIVERNSKHTGKDLPANSKDPAGLPVVDGWRGGQTRQPGWGIIQWTPSGKVVGLAKKAGITTPIYTMGTQLDLLYWHMTVTDPSGSDMTVEKPKGSGITWFKRFNAMTDIKEAVVEFEVQIERALKPANDVRIMRAKNALEKYEGNSTLAYASSSSATSTSTLAASGLQQTGCAPSVSTLNTTDAGLIALIQKYAWPTSTHMPKGEQTDAYKAAIAAAKEAGKYIGGDNGNDCGGFITRLMQDSGRDPKYGGGGNTTKQMIYLENHTELYKRVKFADVKFGDIGIFEGHTFMYIGDAVPGFKAPIVEAALRNGEPSSAPRNINSLEYNNSRHAIYYRYIGGSSAVL